MKLAIHPKCNAIVRRAFSLIEILVTVAILSVIILGLVAMFDQTRKAFTSSLTQVDVLESGRATADIVVRDVEQITAANSLAGIGGTNIYNLYVDSPFASSPSVPLTQPLADPNDVRTNNLQRVYFINRNNLNYTTIGYQVVQSNPNNPNSGVGTLYRYSSTNIPAVSMTNVLANQVNFFNQRPPTNNFSRIIDGVVDFRVRVYTPAGQQFGLFCATNLLTKAQLAGPVRYTNSTINGSIFVQTNGITGDQTTAQFTGISLPAYVEVEIGILEDRTLAHYQALTNGNDGPGSPAWNYLVNHAGQVHIFRQRVPIRNVNPQAYQ